MKSTLIPLLLAALLLTGCAAQNPPRESVPPQTASIPVPTASGPAFTLILGSQGDQTICTYQLAAPLLGLKSLEQDLLIFSGTDTSSLSVLNTETMTITATHDPGFLLMPENATIQQLDQGISYFSSSSMETVVLDHKLQEICRIPAPENLVGFPLLSSDGQTLFYCTADAIRAMDLSGGISRVLKESTYPVQGLSGLLLQSSVLQISITDPDGQWWTLFLSAETGQLIRQCAGNILPETNLDHYFLQGTVDGMPSILYGRAGSHTQTLAPLGRDPDCFYLPKSNRVVSFCWLDQGPALELYDLNSGLRTAQHILDADQIPRTVAETNDGKIWFLCYDQTALYRWDPAGSPVSDTASYAGTYYTREHPDYDGLAACSLYAQSLIEKHVIDILVYRDAAALEPWDYHLEFEYRADLLQRELEALDARLEHFPPGFLQALASRFTDLKICLVRSAVGSPESGNISAVNGLQFMVDFDAYVVLAMDHNTEYALYHELSHLMETVVLTESTAYDRWDNLNPEGFQYDNDYSLNLVRDGSLWLKPGAEYFIDTYSMSYPKEDRARLLEYAMTEGHETLFSSPNLQPKLRQMCIGIRESFDLEHVPEPFLWEQYLTEPLA